MPQFHVESTTAVHAYYIIEASNEQEAIAVVSSRPLMEYAASRVIGPTYTAHLSASELDEPLEPAETEKPTE